ncbi:MAG TPA: ISNCY family transposase [Desulfarculaceae bacterium]|nr:ISNCY family transposase [Desulfarculaceae bacterium]
MRARKTHQMNLFSVTVRHEIGKELEVISEILDENQNVLDCIFVDLTNSRRKDTGRKGLNAEQVLRICILKQFRALSYEELAFHLEDSQVFRAFARLDMGQYPSSSTLQENIKSISESSWEEIHRCIILHAQETGIESGRKIRIDSTAIETDIHEPTDATLLFDGVRIITRWLNDGHKLSPQPDYSFSNHNRVAKKRLMSIINAKNSDVRVAAYRDLVEYSNRVVDYAVSAIPILDSYQNDNLIDVLTAGHLAKQLERAVGLMRKVINQTERRVFNGEKVPASEKIISLFEDHSDIIVKGRRDIQYGHKVFLTGGASSLILDCQIPRGNPADTDLYIPLLVRQKELYGKMPRQVSADGGFASKNNLANAKELKVKDVVFAKRRGLSVLDMAKSSWVYKKLRNFRAGIEANISTLKRAFGLNRCTWKSWEGFCRYVWSSIVAYNLQVMARIKLASV